MDKYYTPEIEEFHIGFEYEEYNHHPNPEWIKKEIKSANQMVTIFLKLRDPSMGGCGIRVKYIDKEDILSLNWKLSYHQTQPSIGNDFECEHNSYKYKIQQTNTSILIYTTQDIFGDSTVFVGEIKNKSEFKRLMKQLNLNPNSME